MFGRKKATLYRALWKNVALRGQLTRLFIC